MCNIFNLSISPKATEQTIAAAFARAEREASFFTCREEGPDDEGNIVFYIRNTVKETNYFVETREIFSECVWCNCPAYEKWSFCKHCAFILEEMRIRELAANYALIDACDGNERW